MDEQQLQQQIVQLVQAALQGDQQATLQIQQIMQAALQGDRQATQIALMIQQVAQQMQLQLVRAARFGAKLNYIKLLNGQCPEGYRMGYYQEGGLLCKKCMKMHQDGREVNQTPATVADQFKIEAAKCGKKMKKKEEGGAIESEKCGGKPKLKKKACGGPMKKKNKISKAENELAFYRQQKTLPGGRAIIAESIMTPSRINSDGSAYYSDFSNDLGRNIYVSPTGNDTVYYNYPDMFIQSDDGFMPAGSTRNLERAKSNFRKLARKSKAYNSNSLDARNRAAKE